MASPCPEGLRHIPAACGGPWSAVQVQRLLARMAIVMRQEGPAGSGGILGRAFGALRGRDTRSGGVAGYPANTAGASVGRPGITTPPLKDATLEHDSDHCRLFRPSGPAADPAPAVGCFAFNGTACRLADGR